MDEIKGIAGANEGIVRKDGRRCGPMLFYVMIAVIVATFAAFLILGPLQGGGRSSRTMVKPASSQGK